MRYVVLDGDNVVNAIEADESFKLEGFDLIPDPDGVVQIGDYRVGKEFFTPAPVVEEKEKKPDQLLIEALLDTIEKIAPSEDVGKLRAMAAKL